MKKRLLCTFIVAVMTSSLIACGKKDNSGKDPNSPVKASSGTVSKDTAASSKDKPSEEEKKPSTDSSSAGLPMDLLNASWPTDLVPEELPEYPSGTVTASGADGGVLYIKIKDTNQSEFYVYLEKLQELGWIVTSDDTEAEALLGLYTVDFDLQGDGNHLQISVYTSEAGAWPANELPSDIIPPNTGMPIEKLEILETSPGLWYFNYTYDDIDEAAAREYMELLRENGWEGDDMMVFKAFEWKGKNYEASVELYETLETRTTFTCNYWLVN